MGTRGTEHALRRGEALPRPPRPTQCVAPTQGDTLAAASTGTVRVMTWNIHGGLGTDRKFDLERVVNIILRHHPDVVALQEVDSRRTIPPASSAFRVLREAVGEHGVEAKSIIAP